MANYKSMLGAAVVLAVAALGGCGNDNSPPAGSSTPAPAPSATPATPAPATPATPAPAAAIPEPAPAAPVAPMPVTPAVTATPAPATPATTAPGMTAAAQAQADALMKQAYQYGKDNKLDLADQAVTKLQGMKGSLPASYGPQIDQLKAALDAAQVQNGKVPSGIKLPGGMKIPGQ